MELIAIFNFFCQIGVPFPFHVFEGLLLNLNQNNSIEKRLILKTIYFVGWNRRFKTVPRPPFEGKAAV